MPNEPRGIALDLVGGKLYWSDRQSGNIGRANLDGSSPEIIVSGLNNLGELVTDATGGYLYWTETGGRIGRSDLDGSNAVTHVGGLNTPKGIAIGRAP